MALFRHTDSRRLPGGDRDGGYGWISIALHWLTAAAIFALLFVGDSIAAVGDGELRLHTTIASMAYILLALRIVWRLVEGHPGGKKSWSHTTGVAVHYALLFAIGLMLVSGPLAAWSSGVGIRIFQLTIPSPMPPSPSVFQFAKASHDAGAAILVWGVLVHVAGVLKHMFVDRDHLFDRIMVPPRRSGDGAPP